ncbi:hypothetical protein [Streptomyces nitrosporeus]|uniref:hypothetical protein n=1 Tax=Streptomyces nitrosporeus TaxID=28894 RepID=UPI00142EE873|nr:hypothetical protein [Streptomyces nitrosporeus]
MDAAIAAAAALVATLTAALTDPTVTTEQVQAVAQQAHDRIEEAGGDYAGVFHRLS